MIWNLGKVTPYGECYPRDLFRQIVSNPMKGAIYDEIRTLLHLRKRDVRMHLPKRR